MIKPIYFIWVISSYLIQWFSTRPSNQISVLHSVLSESCVSSLLLSDLFHRINPGGLTTNMLWRGWPGWCQLPTTINHILIVVLRHMHVLYIYCMCIFKYICIYIIRIIYIIYNCVFLIHIFHDDSCTAKPKNNQMHYQHHHVSCSEAPFPFARRPRTTSSRWRQGPTTSSHTSHPGSPETPKIHVVRCCQNDIYLPTRLGRSFNCKIFWGTASQALMIHSLGLRLWIKCSCLGASEKTWICWWNCWYPSGNN